MSTSGTVALAAAPPERATHRTLAVVLAGFCAFLSLFATQPLLPQLAKAFAASRVAVSLTLTAGTAGVALSAPLIGTIADKLGRKRVIVVSAAMLALTTLLAGTAQTLNQLIAWRFIEGLFTPGIFAVTVAYIGEEWAGQGAGRATAAYVTGTVVGGFFSRFTAGLLASHFAWQYAFVWLGIVGLLAAWALQVWLPKETRFVRRKQGEMSSWRAMADHLKNKRLLATFTAGFCVLFSLLGAFTWITFYLAAPPFRLTSAQLGVLFFVYLVGAVITPNSGRVIDRYGQRSVMAVAVGISASGTLLTLIPSLPVVILGLAMACTGVFVSQSCSNSYLGIAAKHSKALAVGLYVTFYYVGGSLGSSLPGYLWPLGGWPVCVALFVSVQMLTLAIALRWWGRPGQAH